MSIYNKISDIQMELLDVEFETKNGFHGQYMSLPVLICKILPECNKRGLFFYFTANETHLLLKIIDKETGESLSPAPHVRLPELTKDMKVEGGNYTYMKRYLLMNTFMVIAEAFDPEDTEDGLPPQKNNDASSARKKNTKKESKKEPVNVDIPQLYEDALKELRTFKGLNDSEITVSAIRKHIFKNGTFNQTERDEIARYVKTTWRLSK